MKAFTYASLGLLLIWLQVAAAPAIKIFGIKPNLLLLGVVVAALRYLNPWVLVFAAVAGLTQDVFSHGMLGVYGLSYLLIALAAGYAGRSLFEQNPIFLVLAAMGLTLVEGLVSIMILKTVEEDVPGLRWFFGRAFPVAVYHGVLAPVYLFVLGRLARLFGDEQA